MEIENYNGVKSGERWRCGKLYLQFRDGERHSVLSGAPIKYRKYYLRAKINGIYAGNLPTEKSIQKQYTYQFKPYQGKGVGVQSVMQTTCVTIKCRTQT